MFGALRRERRCHCLMVVCCCNWFSGHRKDQARPAYAAMGELFSQVRRQILPAQQTPWF